MMDTKRIYDLFSVCFPCVNRDSDFIEKILSHPDNCVFTQENNGKLIAVCVLYKNAITLLCVHPLYRNRGIGSALLKKAEEKAVSAGYDEISIGVGNSYICPGVPVREMPFSEEIPNERLDAGIPQRNADFFIKRGYFHDREECNVFDMRAEFTDALDAYPLQGESKENVVYRFAVLSDKERVIDCVNDAYEEFTEYYTGDHGYTEASLSRIMIAEDEGKIVGAIIVDYETEEPGVGSIGCTAVRESARGRKIATNMVLSAAKALKRAGIRKGFLSYTYSGLDKMYGSAEFFVSCYYFMALKKLSD